MLKGFWRILKALVSSKAMRELYLERREGQPNEGNRNHLNLLVTLLLFVTLFGVLIGTLSEQPSSVDYLRSRRNISALWGQDVRFFFGEVPHSACGDVASCHAMLVSHQGFLLSDMPEWEQKSLTLPGENAYGAARFRLNVASLKKAVAKPQAAISLPEMDFAKAYLFLSGRFVREALAGEPLTVSLALGEVLASHVDVDVLLVGKGGRRELWRKGAAERLVVVGSFSELSSYQAYQAGKLGLDSSRFGFIARHIMAFFILILFLFIDGSPETLGLGLFLGFEAVAKSFAYGWMPFGTLPAVQHTCYQMGDIFRLYFYLHLARVINKSTVPWLLWGLVLSIPYGILQDRTGDVGLALSIRVHRDLVIGLVGTLICFRAAIFLKGQGLPWRVCALTIAGIGAFEQSIDMVAHYLPVIRDVVPQYELARHLYRPVAYYLLATSTFINISTMENRIKSLSTAKAKSEIEKYRQEQKIYEAIAKTTQMLAHDVRKPFSILKAGLQALIHSKGEVEMRGLLERLIPEVDKSLATVDGMIGDVIDLGKGKEPVVESVSPVSLIQKSVTEVFRFAGEKNVAFSYELSHTTDVKVDPLKVMRLMNNVVENAYQAVGRDGNRIIFTAKDHMEGGRFFVLFAVRNTGSFIPEDKLREIFDPFYTHGKKGGTGLGLAVASRVVSAHGGRIWCSSDRDKGTTFFFTLPAAQGLSKTNLDLPSRSDEIVDAWDRFTAQAGSVRNDAGQASDAETERLLASSCAKASRKLKVLLVDDEPLYVESLKQQLSSLALLKPWLYVKDVSSFEEALSAIADENWDVLVCDIDLGHESKDGFDVVSALRKKGSQAFVCMHSNRSVSSDFRRLTDVGAEAFLLKPMTRSHLVKILERAARSNDDTRAQQAVKRPVVAIVDDDPFFGEAWRHCLGDEAVGVFLSPREFWRATQDGSLSLESLAAIVTDYHFEGDEMDGVSFGVEVSRVCDVPVFLATDSYEFSEKAPPLGITAVIDKEPMSMSELSQLVTLYRRRSSQRTPA